MPLDVDPLVSASQAKAAPKVLQRQVLAQLQERLVKGKISAVAGASAQQEAHIEPKRSICVLQNGLCPVWIEADKETAGRRPNQGCS